MFGFGKARARRREEAEAKQQAELDKALHDLDDAEQALLDKAEKISDPGERYMALVELKDALLKQSDAMKNAHIVPFKAKSDKHTKVLSYGSSGVGAAVATALVISAGPMAIPGGIIFGLIAKGLSWTAGAMVTGMPEEELEKFQVFREHTKQNIVKIGGLLTKIEDEHIEALGGSKHFDKIVAFNPAIREKMSEAFHRAAQKKAEDQPAPAAQPQQPANRRKLSL